MNKKPLNTNNAGSKNQFARNKHTNPAGYTAPTTTGKHDQSHINTNFNKPTTPTAGKTSQPAQAGWKDKSQQGGWKDDKKGGGIR